MDTLKETKVAVLQSLKISKVEVAFSDTVCIISSSSTDQQCFPLWNQKLMMSCLRISLCSIYRGKESTFPPVSLSVKSFSLFPTLNGRSEELNLYGLLWAKFVNWEATESEKVHFQIKIGRSRCSFERRFLFKKSFNQNNLI